MSNRKQRTNEHVIRVAALRQRVADLLTATMDRKKVSGVDLVEKASIPELTRSSISLYRHGRVLPSRDRLEHLMKCMGAEVPEEVDLAYHEATSGHMSQARGQATAKEFVIAWEGSESVTEVCGKLGLTYAAAHSRAASYRKRGVKLKHIKRASSIDEDELNGIIDSLNEGGDE